MFPDINDLDKKLIFNGSSFKTEKDTIRHYFASYVSYSDLIEGVRQIRTTLVGASFRHCDRNVGQLPIYIFHKDTCPEGLDLDLAYIYPQGLTKSDMVCENNNTFTFLVSIADRYLNAYVGTVPVADVIRYLEAKNS